MPGAHALAGRRVLITGAGGFIGSHLVEALVSGGARVRALVHYNSRNDWGQLEHLSAAAREGCQIVSGDLLDPFLVDRLLKEIEIVFHLGALIPIPYSYLAPAQFLDVNVKGTLHVLEAARRHGTARVIQTSSSEVYGSALKLPIDEHHPLQAQSPYAASKIAAEKLAESYWRAFATPVVIVRPFNTYGPRQSARAFVPSVLSQALGQDRVRVGSLDPVRDLNYVTDVVAGFVAAATATGVEGLTVNLGSGTGTSMRAALALALRVTGRSCAVETDIDRMRPPDSEVKELVCDPTLARTRLGWEARTSLEEGFRRTAEWIRTHLEEYKPQLYSV